MTRDEAIRALRDMMFCAQKARSNLMESGNEVVGEDLWPWLFGPKCVLPTLITQVSRAEKGEPIKGSDFYNLMWIAHKEKAIILTADMLNRDLPEPDMKWYTQTW